MSERASKPRQGAGAGPPRNREAIPRGRGARPAAEEAIETNDLSRADQLEKILNAVLSEREVLARLSAWPWSTGTFRGVASAVLLPIGIFLITRILDRVI